MGIRKTNHMVIRLKNRGKKHYPLYDIVVTFNFTRNKGKIVEKIGFYNPNEDKKFLLNTFRLGFWITKGAVINNTVKKYITKFLLI